MEQLPLFEHEMNDGPVKKCTGPCGQEYPATEKYFHRKGKNGLRSKCKSCVKSESKEYSNLTEVQKRRKEYLSIPSIKDGIREQRKERYIRTKNLERTVTRSKEYYENHKEQYKERSKEYRSRLLVHNHIREKKKKYRNLPEVRVREQRRRRAYRNLPDVRERYRVHRHLRRAREKEVLGIHTPEQIADQLKRQRHKCYYCHARLKKTKGRYIYHIEHTFPLSRVAGTDIPANSIDYLVLSCPTCNLSKGDKFPWEWTEGGRLL